MVSLLKKWGKWAPTPSLSCSPPQPRGPSVRKSALHLCTAAGHKPLSATCREPTALPKVSLRQQKNNHPKHSVAEECLWEKGSILSV